jgi:hypothetical protein
MIFGKPVSAHQVKPEGKPFRDHALVGGSMACARTNRAGYSVFGSQLPLTPQQPVDDASTHQQRQDRYPDQERADDRQKDDAG